jgi:predicted dehydrogenase
MTHAARVALAGVHGFGRIHRANLERLEATGRARLVAVADPQGPGDVPLDPAVQVFAGLDELLASLADLDVVIIATPLNTHAALAGAALRAGCDVLLEKPPVSTMADYDTLLESSRETGRAVQVGFQSLGSHALPALAGDELGIGLVTGVSAVGAWLRERRYWERSTWAGKRTMDGTDVVDGVITNPLAHAVATALRIAGATTRESVASVDLDLYHANNIEADDTSVARIRTTAGIPITCALTLCAPEQLPPRVIVHGEKADATFFYKEDVVVLPDGQERSYGRTDLLENLLAHRADGTPLLSSLESAGAFMSVLEAVRTAPAPAGVDPAAVTWQGEGEQAHPVIDDIGSWLERAVRAQATFSELGAPWARPREDAVLARLELDGTEVARLVDGSSVAPASAPRPYLHPVRTLGGVVVSDHHPLDHDWHLGVGVAVQDVAGTNLWGGRTYVRGAGYRPLADQGRVVSERLRSSPGSLTQELSWRDAHGQVLLQEERELTYRALGPASWLLDWAFTLTPAGRDSVTLGSPGSHGREGGGYGGFFWRHPPCLDIDVRTAAARGEDAVHGRAADWLAWSADFTDGPATLILLPGDSRTAADPWFVRASGYPGVGSALAWDTAVETSRTAPLRRSFRAVIADGRLDDSAVAHLAEGFTQDL